MAQIKVPEVDSDVYGHDDSSKEEEAQTPKSQARAAKRNTDYHCHKHGQVPKPARDAYPSLHTRNTISQIITL